MAKVWSPEEEAARLAKRFEGVNQAAFARQFAVPGGASMVSQHIKGRRPISLEAALAYMKGFDVPLHEISPRLAEPMYQALRDIGPPTAAPPPADPPEDFSDRRIVSESDWGDFEAFTIAATPQEKEAIRQRKRWLDQQAQELSRQQIAASKGHPASERLAPHEQRDRPFVGGTRTNFGDLAPEPKQRKGRR